jgi:hypothetical protein
MTIVLTLDTPGEALEAQVLFHLCAGVDALVLLGDAGAVPDRFQGDSRVRAAAVPGDADWIIAAGQGEFWWPRGGSLRDLLSRVPPEFDAVQAVVRPLVAADGEGDLVERSTYRLPTESLLNEPGETARRLVTRAGASTRPLRGWYPIEVLTLAGTLAQPEIERGIEAGIVHADTRLRDALESARAGEEITFGRPSVVEGALFAADAAALGDADAFRLRDELAALDRRLTDLEEHAAVRLERRLRAVLRRGGTRA